MLKSEMFYDGELAMSKIEELSDRGLPYCLELIDDFSCDCYLVSWEE